MKQTLLNKATTADSAVVAGGSLVAAFSEAIPIVVGVLTVGLLIMRVALTAYELQEKWRSRHAKK